MIPVLAPADVKAIDRRASANEPIDEIVERAGAAVALEAISMLGGTYGRRVTVLAGPGLNGADARAAAARLRARGVRVTSVEVDDVAASLPLADLVIDGAFGIGLARPWVAPDPADALVLAVDLPSGLDGSTGEVTGRAMTADRTVTMVGYKQGLLFGEGPALAGEVRVADLGLDVAGNCSGWLLEESDVAAMFPTRPATAHKWRSALLVVAGSPGMTGAAKLATSAAMRAGAGYVRLDSAATSDPGLPVEVVGSFAGSGPRVDTGRFAAAVVGPGLGRTQSAAELVRAVVGAFEGPLVIDGDGLSAIAAPDGLLQDRDDYVVLTPHDGEFEVLTGRPPSRDRVADALELAQERDAVVLLKGPTTVIAHPHGTVLLSDSGDQRLATAGSGDVLAGIIGAFIAQGADSFEAAAAGAYLHGRTAALGHRRGLVASDLVELLPLALSALAPPDA